MNELLELALPSLLWVGFTGAWAIPLLYFYYKDKPKAKPKIFTLNIRRYVIKQNMETIETPQEDYYVEIKETPQQDKPQQDRNLIGEQEFEIFNREARELLEFSTAEQNLIR